MSGAPTKPRKLPPASRWLAGVAGAAVALTAQAQPAPYSTLNRDATVQQLTGTPLRDALQAARSGAASRAQELASGLGEPAARKLVLWAEVDASGASLPFETLMLARTELAGWPRAAKRQAAFEHALETSGASPAAVVAAFGSGQPDTAEGAIALAAALDAQGRTADAQALIRTTWREKTFDADVQARMYNRFSKWITDEDTGLSPRRPALSGPGPGGSGADPIPWTPSTRPPPAPVWASAPAGVTQTPGSAAPCGPSPG